MIVVFLIIGDMDFPTNKNQTNKSAIETINQLTIANHNIWSIFDHFI